MDFRVVVEHDGSFLDVLRAFGVDLGLERHVEEGHIVDVEQKFARRHIIIQPDLPLQFAMLEPNREHAGVCEFFPSHDFFLLHQLNLQQLALLEEGAGDDVAHVVVDRVEADLSLFSRVSVRGFIPADPRFQPRHGGSFSTLTP